MLTTSSLSLRMEKCAPGAWTCFQPLRCVCFNLHIQHAGSKTSLLRNMPPTGPKAWFLQSAHEAKTDFLYHKLCHYYNTLILRSVSDENEIIHLKAQ